ncbi:hypothetical protein HGRIS_014144 [Hohenbuehelia grisea]|uniref:RING-type domain-containing protein n=1 Tax=Hohenbuehelia grisea TaxID=104357 RepID=A0ABR3JUN3_9AGAR
MSSFHQARDFTINNSQFAQYSHCYIVNNNYRVVESDHNASNIQAIAPNTVHQGRISSIVVEDTSATLDRHIELGEQSPLRDRRDHGPLANRSFNLPQSSYAFNSQPSPPIVNDNQRKSSLSSVTRRHAGHEPSPEPGLSGPYNLLDHLRTQSVVQRNTPLNRPLRDPAIASRPDNLKVDLACKVCFRLLHEPMTAPCQHTFCAPCMQSLLDHARKCPLCGRELPGREYFQNCSPNSHILSILLKNFPEEYKARGAAIKSDERSKALDTPILLAWRLIFPGMPTALHLKQPESLLMLDRCLKSEQPKFGIIMFPPYRSPLTADKISYGTMLEIQRVDDLKDGSRQVHARGIGRFRILDRDIRDGYIIAKIEAIVDIDHDSDISEGHNDPTPREGYHGQKQAFSTSDIAGNIRKNKGKEREHIDPVTSVPACLPSTSTLPTSIFSGLQGVTTPFSASDSSSRIPLESSSNRLWTFDALYSPSGRPSSPAAAETPAMHTSRPSHPRLPRHPTLTEPMKTCQLFLDAIRDGNAPLLGRHFELWYGPPPSELGAFSFYVALAIPVDVMEKLKLFPMRSATLRLRVLASWINGFSSEWWYNNHDGGCLIS